LLVTTAINLDINLQNKKLVTKLVTIMNKQL